MSRLADEVALEHDEAQADAARNAAAVRAAWAELERHGIQRRGRSLAEAIRELAARRPRTITDNPYGPGVF